MITLKAFILIFSAFITGPDGKQATVVLPPKVFGTMAQCQTFKKDFETKVTDEQLENVVAYRLQCVDNSMPIRGDKVAQSN